MKSIYQNTLALLFMLTTLPMVLLILLGKLILSGLGSLMLAVFFPNNFYDIEIEWKIVKKINDFGEKLLRWGY